ncbi:MAG: hypothetical protein LBG31_06935 [Prevotellaceae bacterium]|nr:hypothetical protein [Prevotellaceae bacterium]
MKKQSTITAKGRIVATAYCLLPTAYCLLPTATADCCKRPDRLYRARTAHYRRL